MIITGQGKTEAMWGLRVPPSPGRTDFPTPVENPPFISGDDVSRCRPWGDLT